MGKTIEIKLDEHCAAVIAQEVAAGTYTSASELVHEAIQLLEKQKSKVYIENIIQKAEASGEVEDFSREQFIADMKAQHK